MDELTLGDPALLATDVGPVIDEPSRAALEEHAAAIGRGARWAHRCRREPWHAQGTFVAPLAVEIDSLDAAHARGVRSDPARDPLFGRMPSNAWSMRSMRRAMASLSAFTAASIPRARDLARRLRVGNVYVNRNMIGAVVGVQPFGGRGLSGTGPKAGGPHYLHRFVTEQTLTINTAAVGGNTTLLSLGADPPNA